MKKDFEENNLYIQTSPTTITICQDINSTGLSAKVDVITKNSKKIVDFVPLGLNKLITLHHDSMIILYKFNNLVSKKVSEYNLRDLETNFDDLEVATVAVCQRNLYVVVSAHNHTNGSKRRLYLLKIDSEDEFQLLTIKEYGFEEPMRNTYLAISIDFYVDN